MTRRIQIEYVPPSRLVPNPWNSNRVGPEMAQRLAASIEKLDIYKPIIVRQLADGALEILGGEHRWRYALDSGRESVPVVNLGVMSDKQAKTISVADNGQYGEDNALMLAQVLKDIGQEDVSSLLPYSDSDLAGMFAASALDLDSLGFDDEATAADGTELPDAGAVRPGATHALMRFKVPVEDHERVEKFIKHVIDTRGLKAEADSMVAAGMALVEVINAARESM